MSKLFSKQFAMKDGVAVATGHMKIAGSEYRSIGSDEGPFLKLDKSKQLH